MAAEKNSPERGSFLLSRHLEINIFAAIARRSTANIFFSTDSDRLSDNLEPKYDPAMKHTARINANFIFT